MAFFAFKLLVLCLLAGHIADAAVDPLKLIEIEAPDGSARATFIAYGAILTSFWVKDKNGKLRDIHLGFDDTSLYKSDAKGHPYFGPIVGRYANRIRNGTYTIPVSKNASGPGQKFFTPQNEGNNTLHGGKIGFDRRLFDYRPSQLSRSSVTLTMVDPAGSEGFPGEVHTSVTYSLLPRSTFVMEIKAIASEQTPVMLSGHHYWNLEAYKESEDLNGHHMQIQSSKYVETDAKLIPNGKLATVEGNPMDFRNAKSIGQSIPETASAEYCGANCVGYDNCWVFDSAFMTKPVFSAWSTNSGIKMDLYTNQRALQIYTCNGIYNATNPIPRKRSQGGAAKNYVNHSCLVVEAEDIIDGINNPEFGVDQIYGPGRDYSWEAIYKFSTLQESYSGI